MKFWIFFILVFSASVQAAHNCTGKVNSVDIAGTGNVQVNIEGMGDGNILCSVDRVHGAYTVDACKAALSLLLSAKMSEKKVTLYFTNDANNACRKGDWVDFAGHGFYYIQLKN